MGKEGVERLFYLFNLQDIYGLGNFPYFISDFHSLRNGKNLRDSQVLLGIQL